MQIIRRAFLLVMAGALLLAGRAGAQEQPVNGEAEKKMTIPVETVTTDSFSMDYIRFGHGKGTLVILPGLSVQSVMGSADAVAQAYSVMTDDFTVWLFDRRKDLPETYTIADMAADTAAAFRALGLEDACVFGASQGGMIAMEMAIRHPELVKKLVLGSTAASVTEERLPAVGEWIRLAEAGDAEGLYLAFGEALYPREMFEQSKGLLLDAAATVTAADLRRFIILAKGMEGFDVTEELRKIACPVLVIGSSDDRVLGGDAAPQIAQRLEGRPDCRLLMYDGYGHAAYDTAPDYRERMLEFLVAF